MVDHLLLYFNSRSDTCNLLSTQASRFQESKFIEITYGYHGKYITVRVRMILVLSH